MKEHRPGSRKAQVHAHFREHGAESALKFGIELGLASGTVRSWAAQWAKGDTTSVPRMSTGRVKVTWDPNAHVTLITKGEQVSEVKFDDGRRRFIPNTHLQFE